MDRLQGDSRIAQIYSQSAGLADFFMHAQAGRLREPFVRYLGDIYSGRATPRSLVEITGVSYESLDRDYRAFMGGGSTVEGTTAAER